MYWTIHSIEWSLKKKINNKLPKIEVQKSTNFQSQQMFENFLVSRWITGSAAAIVSMYWMTHSIEWSLKTKINNKLPKIEVQISTNFQSQQMFENIISVQRDHRVSSRAVVEWSIVVPILNDHRRRKSKMKFQKLKSRKYSKAKNFRSVRNRKISRSETRLQKSDTLVVLM